MRVLFKTLNSSPVQENKTGIFISFFLLFFLICFVRFLASYKTWTPKHIRDYCNRRHFKRQNAVHSSRRRFRCSTRPIEQRKETSSCSTNRRPQTRRSFGKESDRGSRRKGPLSERCTASSLGAARPSWSQGPC